MITKLINILKKLNFYWLTGTTLFLWLLLFDSNDFISQIKTQYLNAQLSKDKTYYQQQLLATEKESSSVMGTPKQTEKFAREKYLMCKETETVYIITSEDK